MGQESLDIERLIEMRTRWILAIAVSILALVAIFYIQFIYMEKAGFVGFGGLDLPQEESDTIGKGSVQAGGTLTPVPSGGGGGSSKCGDNVKDSGKGETCDDGNTESGDGCSSTCQLEICGDGITQRSLGEECDYGSSTSGLQYSRCTRNCLLTYCGDNVQQRPNGRSLGGPDNDGFETCDDGNTNNNDACIIDSSNNYQCVQPYCGDGYVWNQDCGNSFICEFSDGGQFEGNCISFEENGISTLTDGDNDNVYDHLDNCPTIANNNQLNNDNDDFGNACDNCPYLVNDDQADNDDDGLGNVCDSTPNGQVVQSPPNIGGEDGGISGSSGSGDQSGPGGAAIGDRNNFIRGTGITGDNGPNGQGERITYVVKEGLEDMLEGEYMQLNLKIGDKIKIFLSGDPYELEVISMTASTISIKVVGESSQQIINQGEVGEIIVGKARLAMKNDAIESSEEGLSAYITLAHLGQTSDVTTSETPLEALFYPVISQESNRIDSVSVETQAANRAQVILRLGLLTLIILIAVALGVRLIKRRN